jgi:hypothetical protein
MKFQWEVEKSSVALWKLVQTSHLKTLIEERLTTVCEGDGLGYFSLRVGDNPDVVLVLCMAPNGGTHKLCHDLSASIEQTGFEVCAGPADKAGAIEHMKSLDDLCAAVDQRMRKSAGHVKLSTLAVGITVVLVAVGWASVTLNLEEDRLSWDGKAGLKYDVEVSNILTNWATSATVTTTNTTITPGGVTFFRVHCRPTAGKRSWVESRNLPQGRV